MKFINKKHTLVACSTLLLAACVSNNYTATPTAEAPLENKVAIVGDSLWDHGEIRGQIPRELIKLTHKTYTEFARTNAKLSYILNTELPELPAAATSPILTFLADGGANDIKTDCATSKSPDGPSADCSKAIADAKEGIKAVLRGMGQHVNVQHIAWAGPFYFPSNVIHPVTIDRFVEASQAACSEYNQEIGRTLCHFIDQRPLWVPEAASANLFDSMHVTEEAGRNVAVYIRDNLQSFNAYH